MKSTIASTILLSSLALAMPQPEVARAAQQTDVANLMDLVIAGKLKCYNTAVLFARGTFDSGNIGVWVGPALQQSVLNELDDAAAFQGVSEKDYPASLGDYVKTSGSKTCAKSCAKTVTDYLKKCPTANIFLSGWSQGALCTHTCLEELKGTTALKNIKGVTTFGDEAGLMDPKVIPAFPKEIPVKSFCVEDSVAPDVLCTKTLASGFKLPSSISEFKDIVVDAMIGLTKVAVNSEQRSSVSSILFGMTSGFLSVTDYFLADVKAGKVRRWAVLPQHFKYASNGMTGEAAEWMNAQIKKA
ncbi:carbohydrate esterase family 5 protein [Periconia macrospinosa]|uniref:cutinase n=1 Tax=Periconia macrospinosa TaxID=97972 RepID=A0A2V1D4J1_9PLEO|nr:carbohydrate esterase family 5 protein [Periconia macrospinosa]